MRRKTVRAAEDVTISPSYLSHLVAAALDLLIDGERSIWHLANQGAITHADFARAIVHGANMPSDLVQAFRRPRRVAPRPLYSVLGSGRGLLMPQLDQTIAHYSEAWRGLLGIGVQQLGPTPAL